MKYSLVLSTNLHVLNPKKSRPMGILIVAKEMFEYSVALLNRPARHNNNKCSNCWPLTSKHFYIRLTHDA
jgi:hypothetical protein